MSPTFMHGKRYIYAAVSSWILHLNSGKEDMDWEIVPDCPKVDSGSIHRMVPWGRSPV